MEIPQLDGYGRISGSLWSHGGWSFIRLRSSCFGQDFMLLLN